MNTRERLLALDVFRGMTVAGMLLVNNPGSWGAIYPPLAHATWHGWTPTDLIFPFFLFIVGITTHLSLSARRARGDDTAVLVRQVIRRGALIFACGLFLTWFPGWTYTPSAELADATFGDKVLHRLAHLRIMGVLQRIGLAYTLAGLVTLRFAWRGQAAVAAALLLGYWALMTLVPVPGTGQLGAALLDEPSQVLSAWFDRLVLGEAHLCAAPGSGSGNARSATGWPRSSRWARSAWWWGSAGGGCSPSTRGSGPVRTSCSRAAWRP
jgi:predicted acyltransferase